eukprot:TRINITY_DN52082_c0_g2_i3.p1 TRINITY_DN52082_c0_g2~~TRINITY_DN52082_c0_g2_i3.p1  ORF type:complete len:496 (-),score=74.08 TRINITY_DN52082_c0_g2_i3:317-1777(-)
MARACQVDESLSQYWDTLLRDRKTEEVGLLLGSVGETSKDFLYGLIPTLGVDELKPIICEAGESGQSSKSNKKGGGRSNSNKGSQPTITISIDLVVDHALAVARQLPGGVSVAGVYFLAPDGGLQSAALQICEIMEQYRAVDKGIGEMFVFHVPSNSKNQGLRVVPNEARSFSDMIPCEIKYGKIIQQLVAFKYSYDLNLGKVPDTKATSLKDCLQEAVATEHDLILNMEGVVSSVNISLQGDTLIVDSLPQDTSQAMLLQQPYQLELYSPPHLICEEDLIENDIVMQNSQVQGYGQLSGSMHGITYINRRATLDQALGLVKKELMRSLQTRLDMLIEDAVQAEQEQEEAAPDEKTLPQILFSADMQQSQSLVLPRRVAYPWKAGFKFLDYLLDGETLDYSMIRVEESNIGNLETSQLFEEWEQVAIQPNDAQKWTPFRNGAGKIGKIGQKQNKGLAKLRDPGFLIMLYGIIVGLFAIALYYVFKS